MKTVCMLGEGAWGTAVSTLLAHNGFTVKLWCHDKKIVDHILLTRSNPRYLPGIPLPKTIIPTGDISEAISDVTRVFEAIPVKFMRSVMQKIQPYINEKQIIVSLSKGIENETLLFPSQLIEDVLGKKIKKAVAVGPSYAKDLALQQITALSIAAPDCDVGLELQKMLANEYMRPYLNLDLIGVQVGAALKNVIAIGVGILDGAGYADNVKAFMLTRGLQEMVTLSKALGGKENTMYGLSGVGDLVLTAMGKLSRNQMVGRRLGQGEELQDILSATGYIPEGINTVKSVHALINKKNIQMPICKTLYSVIFEGTKIKDFLSGLMDQPLQQECL